jgi:hypothetical protein
MEHVVFFSEASGEPAYRRVEGLEEAVRVVEELRNEHGIEDASVHTLTSVPLSFRAYYRVEVAADEAGLPVSAALPVPPVAQLIPAEAPADGEEFADPPNAAEDEAADDSSATDAVQDDPDATASVPAARFEREPERSLGYFVQ